MAPTAEPATGTAAAAGRTAAATALRRLPVAMLSLLLLFIALHLSAVHAATPPVDAAGNPIRQFAFAQLQFVSITKINGVEQSFNCDFYMLTTWAAPKHDPTVMWNTSDLVQLQDDYWMPELDFINAIGGINPLFTEPLPLSFAEKPLFDLTPFNYTLPDGWIWCMLDQRYTGEFLTPVDMKAFPFDVQKALMLIESLWSSDQVKIVFAEPGNIHLDHLFPPTMPDILGWKPQGAITTNEDIVYAYNGRIYNRLSLSIALNREPGFFLDKIITGCAMLVVMCILLFLLTAEEADRVMGAMAVFAGLVAYLFVASQYTPVVPYQTALDQFLTLCFMLVLFMTILHGAMFYMREREKLAAEAEEREEAEAAQAALESDDDDEDEETHAQVAHTSAGGMSHRGAAAAAVLQSGRVADDSTLAPLPGSSVTPVVSVELASPSAAHVHSHGPVLVSSASNAAGPGGVTKRLNKRDRKRARKAAAAARRLAQPRPALSSNRCVAFWQTLSLSRKLDFVFLILFSLTFTIGSCVIFGIPQAAQQS